MPSPHRASSLILSGSVRSVLGKGRLQSGFQELTVEAVVIVPPPSVDNLAVIGLWKSRAHRGTGAWLESTAGGEMKTRFDWDFHILVAIVIFVMIAISFRFKSSSENARADSSISRPRPIQRSARLQR